MTLKPEDLALIEAATAIIKKRYRYSKHSIGAAVRMRSGDVFLGVNLRTYADHMAVCAESIALGAAAVWGYDDIDTIVAVRHPSPEVLKQEITVVTPCGACRERIFDYGPWTMVIVPIGDTLEAVSIDYLLPNKYQRPR